MSVDSKKAAKVRSKTPTKRPAAASAKPAVTKPVSRAKTAKAATLATKPVATAARSPALRLAAKSTITVKRSPAKKSVHEPVPFVEKPKKEKAGKPPKAKKAKLVRDSFTMPEFEYVLIAGLKKRCLNAGVSAKKSEILRAAVINLSKLSDTSVLAAVRRLEVIKTGRPAKGSK
ncbi:MAG: hypothetical protein ACYCZL_02295 [Polaromonas sp.]